MLLLRHVSRVRAARARKPSRLCVLHSDHSSADLFSLQIPSLLGLYSSPGRYIAESEEHDGQTMLAGLTTVLHKVREDACFARMINKRHPVGPGFGSPVGSSWAIPLKL